MDNPIGHGWQAAPEDVYGPPPTPQLSRLLSGGYVSAYYLWLLLWPLNLSPDYSHASIPLLEGLVSTPRHPGCDSAPWPQSGSGCNADSVWCGFRKRMTRGMQRPAARR